MATKAAYQTTPRGISVYEHLRDRLRAEVVAPGKAGDKMPGEKSLASQFGVSAVTISKALQELQNEGVITRVPGKGTFLAESENSEVAEMGAPQAATASDPWGAFFSGRSFASPLEIHAGILAPLGLDEKPILYGNWQPRIVSRLEQLVQSGGGNTTTINRDILSAGQDLAAVAALREAGVKLVFLVDDSELPGENYVEALLNWQRCDPEVIVISISMGERGNATLGGVGFDGAHGAFLIGTHLRELGHKRIAYLVPDEPVYVLSGQPLNFTAPRFAALRSTLSGVEGAVVEEIRVAVPTDAERYEGGRELPAPEHDVWITTGKNAARTLELESEFSALVFANDAMARGYILTRREMKREITASLVGYDDRTFASGLGLTTVHPPIEEMAKYALQMARAQLTQPFNAGRFDITLKPTLTRRASTRECPV